MDKQQIKDLIAQNITGQGNQVDISGKLAAILDAIVDEIPAPAPAQEQSDWNEANTDSPAYIKNKPVTHILEVLSTTPTDESESEADALARLKLDGATPTKEQLAALSPLNCYVIDSYSKLSVGFIHRTDLALEICAGFHISGAVFETGYLYDISLNGNESAIKYLEL